MMAEFAHYYPGLLAPDLAWPLFLALYAKTPRFEARLHLTTFDAVREAISEAFSGKDEVRRKLVRAAYPVKIGGGGGFVPNLARPADG